MLFNLILTCLTFTLNATETDLKSLLIANEWVFNTSETLLFNASLIEKSEIIMNDKTLNQDLVLKSLNSQLDIKSVLISKDWKLDVEVMKLDLMLKIDSLPEMKGISKHEKEIVRKSALSAIEGSRFHFEENNALEYKIILKDKILYETKGTFSVDKEKNQLTTNTDDEPNKIYQIISVEENKIVLKDIKTNVNLNLIPVDRQE